jgi:hypothetical protein
MEKFHHSEILWSEEFQWKFWNIEIRDLEKIDKKETRPEGPEKFKIL